MHVPGSSIIALHLQGKHQQPNVFTVAAVRIAHRQLILIYCGLMWSSVVTSQLLLQHG